MIARNGAAVEKDAMQFKRLLRGIAPSPVTAHQSERLLRPAPL